MSDLKGGAQIGPWELSELLGEGGNAEVWRCTNAAGHVAAVKFLKTRKTESQRWERFRREVEFVASLGEQPGIVPVEVFYLPEDLGKNDRAWYSMPIATSLPDALTTASLTEIAERFVVLARTLEVLSASHGAAHRDLKPRNLYLWQDQPAVGDFGLLWRPDMATLSATGEIPGAFSFTAPELFRDDLSDDEISYAKSDVFSLAKTMWAVARAQGFAIPGEHNAADKGLRIDLHRPDPNGGALNRIVEIATVADPAARPTMGELADELEAWLDLQHSEMEAPDLSSIADQIRQQLEPATRRSQDRERLVEFGRSAVARARERLSPLFLQLESELPGMRTNVRNEIVEGMLKSYEHMGSPEVLLRELIGAEVTSQAEALAFELAFGVLVEVSDDAAMRIGAAMSLGYQGVLQNETDHSQIHSVRAGSVEVENAVDDATDWIVSNVVTWLTKFAEATAGKSG